MSAHRIQCNDFVETLWRRFVLQRSCSSPCLAFVIRDRHDQWCSRALSVCQQWNSANLSTSSYTQLRLTGLCTTTHWPLDNFSASNPLLLLYKPEEYISLQVFPSSSESARSTYPVELLVNIDILPLLRSMSAGWIAPSPGSFSLSILMGDDRDHVRQESVDESQKQSHRPSGVSREAGARIVPLDDTIHLFLTGPRPPVPIN